MLAKVGQKDHAHVASTSRGADVVASDVSDADHVVVKTERELMVCNSFLTIDQIMFYSKFCEI